MGDGKEDHFMELVTGLIESVWDDTLAPKFGASCKGWDGIKKGTCGVGKVEVFELLSQA